MATIRTSDVAGRLSSYRRGMGRLDRQLLPQGWGVALALAAAGLVELAIADPAVVRGPRVVLAAVVVLVALALAKRRQRPLVALVVQSVVLAAPALIWGASELGAPAIAVATAVFSCGRYGSRPYALLALPIGAADVLLQNALDPATNLPDSWTWALNVLWIFAAGAWLRQKEQLIARTRAEAAERERTAAIEERLRLARDLHDVLAHNLAVIVVQAEAGRDSASAGPTLDRIAKIARAALGDLRALLPALREAAAEDDDTVPLSPHVGINELPGLASRLSAAGLNVRIHVHTNEFAGLTPAVDECVYRLVQEGLTNAMRHSACPTVDVTIERRDGELHVVVDDPGPAVERSTGDGYGLQGIQERIAALGGSLSAGSRENGFRLAAVLPLGHHTASPTQDQAVGQ